MSGRVYIQKINVLAFALCSKLLLILAKSDENRLIAVCWRRQLALRTAQNHKLHHLALTFLAFSDAGAVIVL